ncbi:hypothetical protein D3C76_1424760 [compost metagenome]
MIGDVLPDECACTQQDQQQPEQATTPWRTTFLPIQLQWVVGQVLQHFCADPRLAAFATLARRLDRRQFVVDLFGRRQAWVMRRGIERIVQAQLRGLRFIIQVHRFQR